MDDLLIFNKHITTVYIYIYIDKRKLYIYIYISMHNNALKLFHKLAKHYIVII